MSDQPPLRALLQLGAELDRAVRADAERRDRRWPWRRTGLFATILVLLSAGVAVATGVVLGTDDPIAPPAAIDLGSEVRPDAGSGQLAGTPSPDPSGGPPWDVRVSRTASGQTCTAVGQRYDGDFGIVGLDRRFRALPLGVADACGTAPTGERVQVGARPVVGAGGTGARTIVAGVAGPRVRAVAIGAAGEPAVDVPIGANRGFVRAVAGYVESARPTIRITATDGSTRTIGLADTGKDIAPDPEGGAPWAVEINPGRGCAQAQRVRASQSPTGDRGAFPVFTDVVCSDRRSGIAVAMRRVSAERFQSMSSRTIVWGRAGTDVTSLELRVPGEAPRPLPIGRHGRSILAVLHGRTDPRAIVLRARLRSGRTVEQRGSTPLRDYQGRRVREPATPAFRSAPDRHRRRLDGFISQPIPGTVRTAPPIADPTAGPAWTLQTFVSRPERAIRLKGRVHRRLTCWAVGRIADGVVRRPTADGDGAPLTLDDTTSSCGPPVRDSGVRADVVSYATGTATYAPRIGRVVVSGTAPTAIRLELRGARDGVRPLAVRPGGAFLAVVAPRDLAGPLRVRATYADGSTSSSRSLPTGRGRPVPVALRTADPDGAAPWAVTATTTRRQTCLKVGQLVDGALAAIDPETGSVRPGPIGSTCYPGLPNFDPVGYNLRNVPNPSREPTPAQVQRRTLGGRTLISGYVARGVTALTVKTPRDVRTIRPSGPSRAYLVVYDGTLTGGSVEITPHRGRRALKTIRIPIYG